MSTSKSRVTYLGPDGQPRVLYEPQDDPDCDQVAFHASDAPNLLALGTRGTGKAVDLDTPIPTPRGYITMRSLKVGDCVFDEQGCPTRIVWKSEPHIDEHGTYQLTFDDGNQIICGGQHEWFTHALTDAWHGNTQGAVRTTEHIAQTLRVSARRDTNHRIPLGGRWRIPAQTLPIDPYVFGVWLGDGHARSGHITTADPEIIQAIERCGYTVRPLSAPYSYGILGLMTQLRSLDAVEQIVPSRGRCRGCHQERCLAARFLCFRCYAGPRRNQYPKAYKGFKRFTGGVLHHKRIPSCYLWTSAKQRLALLQGLMDTDGACDRRQGAVEFCNTNRNLAEGVYQLAISLGIKASLAEGRATLYGKDCGPKYRVTWTSPCPVFRLQRKLKHLPRACRPTQHHRYIVNAERIENREVQCIQVAATSHLYLVGMAGIPTHNSLQLRMDALMRCKMYPGFGALLIRRKITDLRKSHLRYIGAEARALGAVYLETTKQVKFPNGSILQFSHCEKRKDIEDYLSSEWDWIGFDELSTFPLDMFLLISAAGRSTTNKPYASLVRAGSNTLGIGSKWMKQWFIDKNVNLAEFPDYNPDDFETQYSHLRGNKYLPTGQYEKRLKNLPKHVRRAWLDREFVVEGAYFADDWVPTTDEGVSWHVIPTLPTWKGLPLFNHSWLSVYRAIDWGYFPDPAVCLWIALLPNKWSLVFKERTWKRTLAPDVAKEIKRESKGYHIVDTFADPTMFAKTGQSIYSIGDQFEQNGVPLTPSINDRRDFGYSICEQLRTEIDGVPQLRIVAPLHEYGCPELIRTFPLVEVDPTDAKKIGPGEDHWVVALAYYCMGLATPSQDPARPEIPFWMRPKPPRRRLLAVQ